MAAIAAILAFLEYGQACCLLYQALAFVIAGMIVTST
jgi:hypothetical protein